VDETAAICACLQERLPALYPHLFAGDVQASHLNFSAYEIRAAGGRCYIIKMRRAPSPAEQPDEYHYWCHWCSPDNKEVWILKHVHPSVPVPALVEGGLGRIAVPLVAGEEEQTYGYQLQTRLPYGVSAAARSLRYNFDTGEMALEQGFTVGDQGLRLLTKIGAIARKIHLTPARGYGGGWYSRRADYNVAEDRFDFATWPDMVDHLIANCPADRLAAHGLVAPAEWEIILRRAAALKALHVTPRLFHGDLVCNLQNLLVDPVTGEIEGVVDWESAGSGPAFHYECALALRTWHRDGWADGQIDANFRAFLNGYGIAPQTYDRDYRYEVETLLLLLTLDLYGLALQDNYTLRSGGRRHFDRLIEQIVRSSRPH
jgi:hypothetical protein